MSSPPTATAARNRLAQLYNDADESTSAGDDSSGNSAPSSPTSPTPNKPSAPATKDVAESKAASSASTATTPARAVTPSPVMTGSRPASPMVTSTVSAAPKPAAASPSPSTAATKPTPTAPAGTSKSPSVAGSAASTRLPATTGNASDSSSTADDEALLHAMDMDVDVRLRRMSSTLASLINEGRSVLTDDRATPSTRSRASSLPAAWDDNDHNLAEPDQDGELTELDDDDDLDAEWARRRRQQQNRRQAGVYRSAPGSSRSSSGRSSGRPTSRRGTLLDDTDDWDDLSVASFHSTPATLRRISSGPHLRTTVRTSEPSLRRVATTGAMNAHRAGVLRRWSSASSPIYDDDDDIDEDDEADDAMGLRALVRRRRALQQQQQQQLQLPISAGRPRAASDPASRRRSPAAYDVSSGLDSIEETQEDWTLTADTLAARPVGSGRRRQDQLAASMPDLLPPAPRWATRDDADPGMATDSEIPYYHMARAAMAPPRAQPTPPPQWTQADLDALAAEAHAAATIAATAAVAAEPVDGLPLDDAGDASSLDEPAGSLLLPGVDADEYVRTGSLSRKSSRSRVRPSIDAAVVVVRPRTPVPVPVPVPVPIVTGPPPLQDLPPATTVAAVPSPPASDVGTSLSVRSLRNLQPLVDPVLDWAVTKLDPRRVIGTAASSRAGSDVGVPPGLPPRDPAMTLTPATTPSLRRTASQRSLRTTVSNSSTSRARRGSTRGGNAAAAAPAPPAAAAVAAQTMTVARAQDMSGFTFLLLGPRGWLALLLGLYVSVDASTYMWSVLGLATAWIGMTGRAKQYMREWADEVVDWWLVQPEEGSAAAAAGQGRKREDESGDRA
ncbi:hypothetical protein GGF32_008830 [Allomyces javanicus]|nr:hypothetical protein GGF32_008830 [Allomyces javanicus]